MEKVADVNLEHYLEWVELCMMARQAGITPQEIRLYFGMKGVRSQSKEGE